MTIDKQKLQKLLWAEAASFRADCADWKRNTEALDDFLGEKTVGEVALELLAENENLRKECARLTEDNLALLESPGGRAMTDCTELKRLAEACVAAGEYLPGEAWAEDRGYCPAEVAFLEFAPVATPAAVLALIADNDRLREDPGMRAIRSLRGDCADLIAERDQLKAENEALNTAIEDPERARVAGFEEYDFTRLKDRRGDQKVFEITIETECGCDVEEGEYTVRITHLLGNWLGSDDFGLIADAVAEVVADLGLPEEGYTTFIAYESGERQDVYWTKWFEIATVAAVLAEPGAAIGKGEQS